MFVGNGGYRDPLLYCFSLRRGSRLNKEGSVSISPDTCYSEQLPFICEIGTKLYRYFFKENDYPLICEIGNVSTTSIFKTFFFLCNPLLF